MDFKLNASKDYTNTINQSVGPTTSLTSRSLVDTDTSHYIYLDASNGDDGNTGYASDQAKATIAAAYGALTGAKQIIHILDSSTYTMGSNYTFNYVGNTGIQSALGAIPVINVGSYKIILNSSGLGLLSGLILIGNGFQVVELASGVLIIKDNYIYNNGYSAVTAYYDYPCINYVNLGVSGTISYNILVTEYGSVGLRVPIYTSAMNVLNNIIYLNSTPQDGTSEYHFLNSDSSRCNLGGSYGALKLDFDSATLVATIEGTSTVTSFSPGVWAGYVVFMTGAGGLYYITDNNSTQLILEDRFGIGSGDLSAVNSFVYGRQLAAGILVEGQTASTLTSNVIQNIIVGKNHKAGIIGIGDNNPTANTMNVNGNVVLNCEYGILAVGMYPQLDTNKISVVTAENILYSTVETDRTNLNIDEYSDAENTDVTISSDNYSQNLRPLYFNQQNALTPVTSAPYVDATLGYVKCAYDFRLRQKGKKYYTTDTQIMILDSPLLLKYAAPTPDEDLCPWEETLTEGSIAYADLISVDYPPRGVQIAYTPKNAVEVYDLHGNPKIDWDAWRKTFNLSWQRDYVSNELIWNLYRLFEDKGVKRFYPREDGESIMTNSTSGAIVGVTSTTATFTPAALSVPMVPHHWKGFWITLFYSASEADFYIEDNTATTLSLIDKLGNGLPSDDNYLFTIEYILVQTRPTDYQFEQANFTNFLKGGVWEEKDEIEEHEWTGIKIVLIEEENPV